MNMNINTAGNSKPVTEQIESPQSTISGQPAVPPVVVPDPQPPVAPKSDVGGSSLNAEQSEPRQSSVGGQPSSLNSQPTLPPAAVSDSSINSPLTTHHSSLTTPSFPRFTGESPRAYNAFMTFFQLGNGRSRQAVADKLDESIDSIKKWSTRFDWSERIQTFNSGLLQQHAKTESIAQQKEAAELSARMTDFRRQQADAAQKMLSTVEFYLESCGEQQLENMTLSQAAQALNIASNIGRLAMSRSDLPEEKKSALSSIQNLFKESVERIYGQAPVPETQNQNPSNPNPSHVQNGTSQFSRI